MNMLDDSATWLAGQLTDNVARSVTYSRGVTSATVSGTLSSKLYSVMDEEGFVTAVQSSDWTFIASDLVVSGSTITPRPGDRITYGSAVYEARPMGDGQAYETLDANGTLIVVHTKRVA